MVAHLLLLQASSPAGELPVMAQQNDMEDGFHATTSTTQQEGHFRYFTRRY